MYLVSSCLVGINCRYNGSSATDVDLVKLMTNGKVIAICPEILGGLDTLREACELRVDNANQRKVVDHLGNDYTEAYMLGAKKTLELCKVLNIETAILKAQSPSCGCGKIYDGTFTGKLIEGNGLVAQLLLDNGIKLATELNFKDFI